MNVVHFAFTDESCPAIEPGHETTDDLRLVTCSTCSNRIHDIVAVWCAEVTEEQS